MLPWTPRPPLLYHIVSCTSLSLQLLGTQDFVDVVEAVFGGLHPMGVVRQGGIQAAVLGGRKTRGGRAMGEEQRRLVVVLLPEMQGPFWPFRG